MTERKRFYVPGEMPNGTFRIECKVCGCKDMPVVNSYGWGDDGKPRRRQCRNCGWILRTIELPVEGKE